MMDLTIVVRGRASRQRFDALPVTRAEQPPPIHRAPASTAAVAQRGPERRQPPLKLALPLHRSYLISSGAPAALLTQPINTARREQPEPPPIVAE
jgi:hypothetical protein